MSPTPDEYVSEAPRLVKLRLPATLVRAMDQAIAASDGAYLDRNDFVGEAIRDRLMEEGRPTRVAPPVASGRPPEAIESVEQVTPTAPAWGTWRGRPVECLPPTGARGVSFGLHNRDLPTLWALDRLAAAVAEIGSPVAWSDFVAACAHEAVGVGAWLEQEIVGPLRGGIGFPRSGAKAKSSADRFIWASIGSQRGQGPLFALGLAGRTDSGSLAPTEAGLELLRALVAGGSFTDQLPHPSYAWWLWLKHLNNAAQDEAQVWLKILKLVEQKPTRAELNAEFPEWPGSQADTNCMGFISRSREWGLVEPQMQDGRYRLTNLGLEVVAQEGSTT